MSVWDRMRWWDQVVFLGAGLVLLATAPIWVIAATVMVMIVYDARRKGDE